MIQEGEHHDPGEEAHGVESTAEVHARTTQECTEPSSSGQPKAPAIAAAMSVTIIGATEITTIANPVSRKPLVGLDMPYAPGCLRLRKAASKTMVAGTSQIAKSTTPARSVKYEYQMAKPRL